MLFVCIFKHFFFNFLDGFFIESCNGICFCDTCLMSSDSDKENEGSQRTGEPEREFWLPRGWCSFELRRTAASEPPWHIAYCQLPAPTLRRCLDSRALLSGSSNWDLSKSKKLTKIIYEQERADECTKKAPVQPPSH